MIGGFCFIHDSRTYTCQPEEIQGERGECWWWFTVSRDGNRYAPFRALARDTRASIQSRIVEYYANHLAHRSMPDREHWARRDRSGAGAAKPAAAASGQPARAGVKAK